MEVGQKAPAPTESLTSENDLARQKRKEKNQKQNKTEAIRTCCSSSAELNCVKYKPGVISRLPSFSGKTKIFIFTLGEKMKERDKAAFN